MLLDVHFTSTGEVKELEFDEVPFVDEVITIVENGVKKTYWITSVGGPMDADLNTRPGFIMVKPLEEI